MNSEGIWALALTAPLTNLPSSHLTATVSDAQGNRTTVKVRFWIGSQNFRILSLDTSRLDESRHMDDRVAAAQRFGERRVGSRRQISGHLFEREIARCPAREGAARTRESAHRPSFGAERAGDVAADETRPTGQERCWAGHGSNSIDSVCPGDQDSAPRASA